MLNLTLIFLTGTNMFWSKWTRFIQINTHIVSKNYEKNTILNKIFFYTSNSIEKLNYVLHCQLHTQKVIK